MRALNRISLRQVARQIAGHVIMHLPHNSGRRTHDRPRSEGRPQEQSWAFSSVFPYWNVRCSFHAAVGLERFEHCWALQESYHKRSDTGLFLRGQYPRNTDIPGEAGPGLYLWQDQHHRHIIGLVLRGCRAAALQRLVEPEERASVGRDE